MGDYLILEKLKCLIKAGHSADEICSILNVKRPKLEKLVNMLGKMEHEKAYMIKNSAQICFVSDPHYGSIVDRPDLMQEIYNECEKRGINTILCAGDFTDGYYPNYPERYANQKVHTVEDLVNYSVYVHPRSKNIKFYTIGGNHDIYLKDPKIDILEKIANIRNDIIYLGPNEADFIYGPTKIKMFHGVLNTKSKDTKSRAWLYYNSLSKNKPDIIQMGHIHHSYFDKFDKTYIIQNAALIDQLNYAKHKGFKCERSCFFVTIFFDEKGNIIHLKPELMVFEKGMTRVRTK